jgi:NTE family protein
MAYSSPIGIALGGGSARGWAHIGILNWLRENGIEPHVICGTSIGALVGGIEAAGETRRLQDWVLKLEWQDVLSYLDVGLAGGLIRGAKLFEFFRRHFDDRVIEDLSRSYAAVATELATGQEIWLREGSLLDAIRASIAVPGLFTPERKTSAQEWLVDGGLVNPVPVSLCRALGARRVIAVDLNTDILERFGGYGERDFGTQVSELSAERRWTANLGAALRERAQQVRSYLPGGGEGLPSMVDVVTQSVYIMQVRITRSRLAGDPPDMLLTPRLGHISMMEFHRADEAIREGYRCAQEAAPVLEELLRRS